MLVAYPLAVATPHGMGHWVIFAVLLVFSLGYGLYASHRIRRTVLASDDKSYTVRLEWIPLSQPTSDGTPDTQRQN